MDPCVRAQMSETYVRVSVRKRTKHWRTEQLFKNEETFILVYTLDYMHDCYLSRQEQNSTLAQMSQSSAMWSGPVQIERQCHSHEVLQLVYILSVPPSSSCCCDWCPKDAQKKS